MRIYSNSALKKSSWILPLAHSRVGRGNLNKTSPLTSVLHFLPNSVGIARGVAELNIALLLATREGNETITFSIFSSGK